MNLIKRVAIDLDSTICNPRQNNQTYADVEPMEGAVEAIKSLRETGIYIILHTARGMATYDNNTGKILAGMEYLYEWLRKWDIQVDEIVIGKPNVDIFIDDKAWRHTDWKSTMKFIEELYG